MADGTDIELVGEALREWVGGAGTARLGQLLPSREADVGTPDESLDRYTRDVPDERALSTAMRAATVTARGDWRAAAPTFCDELVAQPDYDVPYIWLAGFLRDEGETALAIGLLRYAAARCRRKSILLSSLGEYLLFDGEPRAAVHAYAQSIAAMRAAPRTREYEEQRTFLCMAELLDVYEDVVGWRWIRRRITETVLDVEFARSLRAAAFRTSTAERDRIVREVPVLTRRLRRLLPRKPVAAVLELARPASWVRARREQSHRQMLVRSYARRATAEHDAGSAG